MLHFTLNYVPMDDDDDDDDDNNNNNDEYFCWLPL